MNGNLIYSAFCNAPKSLYNVDKIKWTIMIPIKVKFDANEACM